MGSGAFGLVWPITKVYAAMFNIYGVFIFNNTKMSVKCEIESPY